MIIFETPRTIVRRFTAADSEDFFALNGSAEAMHYIRAPKNRAQSDDFLKDNINLYLDDSVVGRFAVHEKTSQQFLGTFSLLWLSGEKNYHIGYALLPAAWGKGFATELVKAGTPYFFSRTPHNQLFAITHPLNIPSQQVLLKSGYYHSRQLEEEGKMLELFVVDRS